MPCCISSPGKQPNRWINEHDGNYLQSKGHKKSHDLVYHTVIETTERGVRSRQTMLLNPLSRVVKEKLQWKRAALKD